MSMQIKKANPDDAKIISSIHAASWKATFQGSIPQPYLDDLKADFWIEMFQEWITNNKATALIMYENEVPIGCIAYGALRDETLVGWGEIISLYFIPSHCGKGYGQQLFQTAVSELSKAGMKNISLWVLKENNYARTFYKKMGFRHNGDENIVKIAGKSLTNIRYIANVEV